MAQGNYTSVQSIDAARGEILDRYGRPLAVNQVSYDIMINEAYLPADMKNTVIERIILLMEQEGQTWIDTLPISTTEPFTFLTETDSQKTQIEKLKTDNKINLDATADVTLNNLLDKYDLLEYNCASCGYIIREISAPRRIIMSALSAVQQNPSLLWQTAPWRARLREYAIRWRFMAPTPAIHTPSRKIFQSMSWLRFGNTASRCRVWKSRRQPAAVMWTEHWLRTR